MTYTFLSASRLPMILRATDIAPTLFPHLFDGTGTLQSRRLLTPTGGSNLRAVVVNCLPPGSSIGRHRHVGEEDFYFGLSGEGLVLDHDEERPFAAGTLQITRDGEYQGLRNTGSTDLVFLAALVATPSR